MNVVFRVDASAVMGSGHLMRCMTLANGLRARGADCHFVCREHAGHLIDLVRQHGFGVNVLPVQGAGAAAGAGEPAHTAWLGCDWETDAQLTRAVLDVLAPDCLVVDHYALDWRWESAQRDGKLRILVVDDLADRAHDADVLVDQNLGRHARDYGALVPAPCKLLTGPGYALLRPEFAEWRERSLARPRASVKHLFVNMGGVDLPNATGAVLMALHSSALPADCRISVVMGLRAPWVEQVRAQATLLPWHTEVFVGVSDMAQRMADSDLSIGAAGSTSWERSCLGLPTLLVVLAANQVDGAAALEQRGAAHTLGGVGQIGACLPDAIGAIGQHGRLAAMSMAASGLVDGLGMARVADAVGVWNG